MGFYSPNAIVAEARRHGITIHAVDVQHSGAAASASENGIRLGLNSVRGLGTTAKEHILRAREAGEFRSLEDFVSRTRLDRRSVEALILGGAFDSWEIPRRQLVWDLQAAKIAALAGPNPGPGHTRGTHLHSPSRARAVVAGIPTHRHHRRAAYHRPGQHAAAADGCYRHQRTAPLARRHKDPCRRGYHLPPPPHPCGNRVPVGGG